MDQVQAADAPAGRTITGKRTSPASPELAERPEETLDPGDWEALRRLGHRMVDDVIALHRGIADEPAWRPVPDHVRDALRQPPPQTPEGADAAYDDFRDNVLPYYYGNIHPRGWGWVNGTGTTLAAFAEMLGAAMNPNVWGGQHAAPLVEAQVLDWIKRLLGFPDSASGILTSGGSVANLIGLAAARDAVGDDVAATGLRAQTTQPVVYASTEAHNSVDRAVALLGIGLGGLRRVPTDDAYRMDAEALEAAIAHDRRQGLQPIAVVASAGTVNTGAIDPLDRIADICAHERIWLHVDGAFGAAAALSPALRPLVSGIERADSLATDLHKWLFMPIEIGCVLVRDPAAHRRPFAPTASYLQQFDRGIASGPLVFSELGPQLTRGFRALKAWLSFKAHGTDAYARIIEQNVRQARALERFVLEAPDLELVAPVPLNVVCLRFIDPALDDRQLDRLNRELLIRIQEAGDAAPSSTVLHGRFALRLAFTNHRTRMSDVEFFVRRVRAVGRELAAEHRSAASNHPGSGPG